MSDIIKTVVNAQLNKAINEKYPHIKLTSCVYVEITRVENLSSYYNYSVKVLDENKTRNTDYPEVPNVTSSIQLEKGDYAVAIMLYGKCDPYIIGKVI